jgi:small subunit ribosomal protein S21
MLIVKCSNGKIEWALKKYRQKVEKTRQVHELRDRQEFEKPSIKRRRERQKASYRQKHGNSNV